MAKLVVRKMGDTFRFDELKNAVIREGYPEDSYSVVAGSILLPALEPYLIRTMKAASQEVSDPELREVMATFNGQESQHYQQHQRFNDVIKARNFPGLEKFERELQTEYRRLSREKSLKFNLAYAACFEALTTAGAATIFEVAAKLMPTITNLRERARCKRVAILLAVLLFSVLVGSDGFAQTIKDGRAALPEVRIQWFQYLGADEDVIRQTLRRIATLEGDAPGSWVYEWRSIAEYHEERGDAALDQGLRQEALDAYMTAGVYYALSWFPMIETAEKSRAHAAHQRLYRKGGKLFDVPLEVVNVPFQGGHLVTYLHRPTGIDKPPLVIWTGGADQYKANFYRSVKTLTSKGLAVVTFDLPGFGDSTAWTPEPTSDEAHIAVMEHFIARKEFEAGRIGVVGISWGGFYATRLATRNDPRIGGVAAVCGIVHDVYEKTVSGSPEAEGLQQEDQAARLGVEAEDDALKAVADKFSLVDEGLLGQGKTITTPLLLVNGTRDLLNPIPEIMLTYESAVNADLWLLGLGGHCAMEYWPIVIPDLAEWLLEKLAK